MNELLNRLGANAKAAATKLNLLTTEEKNNALRVVSEDLIAASSEIIRENAIDMKNGKENGMSLGIQDRLLLTEDRIKGIAEGIVQVAELEDPIGEILEEYVRPNGMKIQKKRVPFGVVAIIYESRPNVTADAFALCFKTGNAVILRGGSDAFYSIKIIVDTIRASLKKLGLPEDAVAFVEDTSRETATELMKLNEYVDVLIPRGNAGLIRSVVQNATVPYIETGTGNCHIYVDESADIDMAVRIILNAKTQRVGVCNAAESLLVHRNISEKLMKVLSEKFHEKNVEMRADDELMKYNPYAVAATEEDWGKEYLDYIISMKTVSGVDEAIAHVNRYHTGHSDCIVTENEANAVRFLNEVDSAAVYWNVSTRFTDGFEFGFGAEIGISTQKLHARGPMGLKELTSYKYVVTGNGLTR